MPRTPALLVSLCLPFAAAAETVTWPVEFYDPAATTEAGPADMVLPMPCGAGLALQRVEVPVDGTSVLADRRLRLGSPDDTAGFTNYMISTHLRGGFNGPTEGVTHYYLGRYELTADQAAALRGQCNTPSTQGRVPALGLSWFDAVELARLHTEWLRENAPDLLPREGAAHGFLRLPTEAEWEYGARGGVAVDTAGFAAPLYPMADGLDAYAWHQAVARGAARPVGLRGANPLGLHDIYGNAEELMLEPFRANAAGRVHGQSGGLVTRGGSFLSAPDRIGSALRNEWPMYRVSDGKASAAETFGARFAIGVHLAIDDQRLNALDVAWQEALRAGEGPGEDPLSGLEEIIADETDQARLAVLAGLRQSLVAQRDGARQARLETLRANLANGAVLVSVIRQTSANIARFEIVRNEAMAGLEVFAEGPRRAELQGYLTFAERELSNLVPTRADALLSYGRSLESLAALPDRTELDVAFDRLMSELRAGDQIRMQELLVEFLADITEFARAPRSGDDLIRLAMEP
jgi:hypothetical protein